MNNIFESTNDAQMFILEEIIANGKPSSPRGSETLEILNMGFTIKKPIKRLTTLKKRCWSLPLAIGELCWHLSSSHSGKSISYYAKNWANSSNAEGNIEGSCYGRKAFSPDTSQNSQWDYLKEILSIDPQTRRAVLSFSDSLKKSTLNSNDISCLSSIQFLIREGKLHCLSNMRSNDAFIGLPYDIFLFTFLQEILAKELNLSLGEYHHNASSMHIYKENLNQVESILSSGEYDSGEMKEMGNLEEIPLLLLHEKELRQPEGMPLTKFKDPYWAEMADVLDFFKKRKNKQDSAEDKEKIRNALYREIVHRQHPHSNI